MSIAELFEAAESAQAIARTLQRDIALIQRDCPHAATEPDGVDADDFAFERCTACRLSGPVPIARPRP